MKLLNFLRHVVLLQRMDVETARVLTVAEPIKTWKQYSLETNHVGSNSSIGFYFIYLLFFYVFYSHKH